MNAAHSNWDFTSPIFRPWTVDDEIIYQEGIYYNQFDDKIQMYSINLTSPADDIVLHYAGAVKLFCTINHPTQPDWLTSKLPSFQQSTSDLSIFAGKLAHNLDETINHFRRMRKESGLDQVLDQAANLLPKSLQPRSIRRDIELQTGDLVVDLDFLGLATVTAQMDNIREQIQQMVNNLGVSDLIDGITQIFPEFTNVTKLFNQHYGFHFAVDPHVDDGHRHRYRLRGNGNVTMKIPIDINNGAEVTLSLDKADASPLLPPQTTTGFTRTIKAGSDNSFLNIKNQSGITCTYELEITTLPEPFLVSDRAQIEE